MPPIQGASGDSLGFFVLRAGPQSQTLLVVLNGFAGPGRPGEFSPFVCRHSASSPPAGIGLGLPAVEGMGGLLSARQTAPETQEAEERQAQAQEGEAQQGGQETAEGQPQPQQWLRCGFNQWSWPHWNPSQEEQLRQMDHCRNLRHAQ